VMARKSICDREILEHTGGQPLTISGWESINGTNKGGHA